MRYSRVVALALACPVLWFSTPILGAGQSVADFSGTDSYIDLGTPDALQIPFDSPFTVEGWVTFDEFSATDML